MSNTIREDVVSISFNVEDNPFADMIEEIEEMKKAVTGGVDDSTEELRDMAKEASKTADGVDDLTKAVEDLGKTDMDDLNDGLKDTKKQADESKKESDKLHKALKDVDNTSLDKPTKGLKGIASSAGKAALAVGKIALKGLAVGAGASAAAVGGIVKSSISAYADYEQLSGGVETLFKKSAPLVEKYANDAYKTAGLSANQYMDTVTSFSASLLSSVGGDTKKAAKMADMAITDMSDNANKMGTDMDSIIATYQSLAKGNYAMLDNLKLGYGGTKTEMQRLIKDAAKIDKSVKANDMSYGNLVKAIHAVQDEMGITGTTAKESSETISGSLAAMKSAWSNLLPALIKGGDSFDQCVKNLVDSAKTFMKNLKPALKSALTGVGELIEELAPILAEEMPNIVNDLLPPLIKAAGSILQGLIKALPTIMSVLIKEIPNIIKMVMQAIVDAFGLNMPILDKIGGLFSKNADKIGKMIPVALGLAAAFKGFGALKSLGGLFGGGGGAGGKGGGVFSGIINAFKSLAKAKPTTILKGLANLSIIIIGVGAIAAGLMAIAPFMAELTDMKSFGEVVVTIIAVGVVGGVLAKVAGIVGNIPISVVAKGVAGIAIVLAGMTAIVLAFGALTHIKGFNDFIDRGGKILVKICTIIGEMAGSIIGGFAAGLTNGLPKIGENIAAFANNIKPIFNLTKGTDAKGLGDFLKVLGSFLLELAANDILALFTGGTDFVGLGKELTNFAESSQGFFEKVALFPAKGISNAAKLFESLADIGNVPNTGGIAQWFSGTNDYAALAEGLNELSSDKVVTFYETVAEIPKKAFSKTVKLFESIKDIGNVPNTGGIAQWFSGTNDYAALAEGFKELSSDKVKGFMTWIKDLPQKTFDNTVKYFDTLGKVGNVPNTGGISQWFSGTNDYKALASGLGELSGEKVKGFFDFLTKYSEKGLDNMVKFFQALGNIGNIPNSGGIGNWFSGTTDYEALAKGFDHLSSDSVGDFLTFVQYYPQIAFDNMLKFFQSLGAISSVPNTGGISQWFSGTNDYAALASGLEDLSSEGVKGFMTWVKDIPQAALDNTVKFFNALSNVSQLPKSGGLSQWFDGTIDYSSLADGLGELSGEKVKGFLDFVSSYAENGSGFDNMVKFFNALSNVSQLPKSGGLMQWFDGTVDYEALASGLASLSSESVKGFMTFMNDMELPTFDKMIKFFTSLVSLSEAAPTSGGMFQFFTGTEDFKALYDALVLISAGLQVFTDKIDDLDTKKVDDLWASFEDGKKIVEECVDDIANTITNSSDRMKVAGTQMMRGLINGMNLMKPVVLQTARTIAKEAADTIDEALDINSPSRVTTESGEYASLGLAKGMQRMKDKVTASARGISNEAAAAITPSMNKYTPSGSVSNTNSKTVTNNYNPQFTLNMNGASATDSNKRKVKQWVKESIQETFESMGRTNPEVCEV